MNDSDRSGESNDTSQNGAEDAAKPAGGVKRANSWRQSRAWTITKWSVATTTCVCALLVGLVAGNLYYGNPLIKNVVDTIITTPRSVITQHDLLADYTVPNKFPANNQHVINVLLLGCDTDYVGKMVHHTAVSVPLKTNGRSDAIMMARFDFDANTVSLMSIPRDTAVHIPDHGTTKINSAYALGGADLTKETIKDVFGIDTDFYVALHFEAFQKLVEALGGVDVVVHKDLDYDDNWAHLHIHLRRGPQHLSGNQAMGYVRIRHSDSDMMRAQRQHEFIEALRVKIKSPSILLHAGDALKAITDNIKTDLSNEELITLAHWSSKLPKEHVVLETLPSIEGPSYVYIKVKESQDMISKLFFGGLQTVSISAPGPEIASARTGRKRHHGSKGASPDDNPTVPQADGQMPDGATDGTDAMPSSSAGSKDHDADTPKKSGGDAKPGDDGKGGGGGGAKDGGPKDSGGKDSGGKDSGGKDSGGTPAAPGAVGAA